MSNSDAPPIVAGFFEGLFAPVLEVIFDVILTAFSKVSSTTGAWIVLFAVLLFVMDIVRNVLLGLKHNQFAIGNLAGNICGLFLFYGTISSISSEAANNSILLTAILASSLVIGIIIYVRGS